MPAVSNPDPPLIEGQSELADWLEDQGNEGLTVLTHLRASERVIARVTDGIYRQPASALRELISNAWDADANRVTIVTDAPRFARIEVRDDGAGMDKETLVRLLKQIGGSAKRRREGQALGVTAADDPNQTPKGRPLIGKIGIGLFSVSQLALGFRIVTKVQGKPYRLVADVRMRTYSEGDDDNDEQGKEDDDSFLTGEVYVRREYTDDLGAHGTDVIIDNVKPRVRDLLRSAERWQAVSEKAAAEQAGDDDAAADIRTSPPVYHSGWIEDVSDAAGPAVLTVPPELPWMPDTPAEARMGLLMDAVESQSGRTERPDLATVLDTYLETLWTLGLSAPVEYVDTHPFDLTSEYDVKPYWLSNKRNKGQALELSLAPGQTVREAAREQVEGSPELEAGLDAGSGPFRVEVDGVELRRPIRFRFRPTGVRGLPNSMLFVGRWDPNLAAIDRRQRGGDLELEAYLFWNGRVIPKENNGVLVRIREASGALFDSTFFNYQISEQTRLRQITAELFVRRGLDAALNIDRESFNFAHPHFQLVSGWTHRAIRQLTNRHKEVSRRLREGRKDEQVSAAIDAVTRHAEVVWETAKGDEPTPEVIIVSDAPKAQEARRGGDIVFERSGLPSLGTKVPARDREDRESKALALARILAAFDVLTDRPYDEQQALIEAILATFFSSDA